MYAYFAKIIDETLYTLFDKVPSLPKINVRVYFVCIQGRKYGWVSIGAT